MTEPLDDVDTRLLGEVHDLMEQLDPVPAGLTDRIKLAVTVAALNAELAELTAAPLAAVRDDVEEADSLTFTSSWLSLMITVAARLPSATRLDGWVSEPGARVEVHHANGVDSVVADDTGRLVLHVPRGAVWFLMRPADDTPDGRPVVTPAVTL